MFSVAFRTRNLSGVLRIYLETNCFSKAVKTGINYFSFFCSVFQRLRKALFPLPELFAFVANSRQFSHLLCKDVNTENQKFKRKELETLCENVKIRLTLMKEGKCKRNQNDPNHSHGIFQGKSTLQKTAKISERKLKFTVTS